ncbi:Phenol 2-monooxygenase [Fusarium oxysporum f. sp. cubense race 1]|uniref:Phenol 2-monooxygenase n=1 Tax=Fusarium oxysporum f. sp. cubense (strain race 1) TaxID=1229664 RepID=N4TJF2_FUSC1|nr:Phenol 2-monooxygenase [Fusarium oxysporum f. sp. cubense race 1]
MESEKVQVIICGGGSAGLTAAIWLARFNIDFKILERRPGPLEIGQADGVQCRTVEIFENLGISERLLEEAYHVMEVAFWSPDDNEGLVRKDLAYDTEEGLSHQPHVILNQARMNDLMLQEIIRLRGNGTSGVLYNSQVESVRIVDDEEYPVEVVTMRNGEPYRYRAKYAIGCDGAHSTVRKSLGFKMVGDSSDSVWGVMDVYPVTNFPDIRKKAMLQSKSDGNLMIIPREGDELVRFYIELSGTSARDVTEQDLINKVKRIFHPYDIDIARTVWWSAYVIGQRLADHFTKDHRIFLTGDACHTHSPKAGQGMNVSLQDGFNIGWKMAHVLTGRAPPSVLETYVLERQQTAQQLIEFDRSFSKLFSSEYRKANGITAKHFRDKFVEAGRYTAGMATRYKPSIVTSLEESDNSIASGLTVGMRFPSAPVVRLSDTKPMQLNKNLAADGRWHLLTFCSGDFARKGLHEVSLPVAREFGNLIKMFTPAGDPVDKVFSHTLLIKAERKTIDIDQLPEVFFPHTGPYNLRNVHRVFVDDTNPYMLGCGQAFSKYGIDAEQGAIVVVRPDLYTARVLSLSQVADLFTFFKGCLSSIG